jgi:Sister chromatid cohesion protein Dcc1
VAQCVARRLFQRTNEWEESALLVRWQAEMPGVGAAYQVNPSMLSGLAYSTLKNGSCNWTYWPNTWPVPPPAEFFAQAFGAKSQWRREELSPYLMRLTQETGRSEAELLLAYTRVESPDNGDAVHVPK